MSRPTYPKGPGRVAREPALGTVGILDVADGVATFEVVELSLFARNGEAEGSFPPLILIRYRILSFQPL